MKEEKGFIREILLVLGVLIAIKYFFDLNIIDYCTQYLDKIIEWVRGLR